MHEPPPECGGSSTAHGRERQTVLFVLSSSLEVYGLEGHATGASASRTRLRISPPPPSSADTRVQAHACVPGAAFRWARRARDSALTRRARHHDLFPYVPLKEDKAGKIVPTPNYLGILNFLHSLWLPPPLLTLMPVLPTLSACQSVEVTSSSLSGKTPPQHQCLHLGLSQYLKKESMMNLGKYHLHPEVSPAHLPVSYQGGLSCGPSLKQRGLSLAQS